MCPTACRLQMPKVQNAKTKSRARGLTLVEVLVAAAVLAIAITGLMVAIYNAQGSNQMNRELSIARDAAQQKLDEIRASDYNSLTTNYGGSTISTISTLFGASSFPGSTWVPDPDPLDATRSKSLPNGQGTVLLDYSSSGAVCTVRIYVTWTGQRKKPHPFSPTGANVSFYETSAIIAR